MLEQRVMGMHSGGMKMTAALPLAFVLLATAPAALAETPFRGEHGQSASLTLIGEDGKAQTASMLDLSGLPRATAAVTHEGRTLAFKGVLLADVLKRVNAPMGKDLKGPALSDVVIVTAKDGYTVVLALSDLEPSIHAAKVILADQDATGAPLAADKDGPFRLVVDGDLKPARSARNVVAIEVRRLRASH